MNGYLSISGMIWNTFSNSRATGDYLQQTDRGRYYQGTRGARSAWGKMRSYRLRSMLLSSGARVPSDIASRRMHDSNESASTSGSLLMRKHAADQPLPCSSPANRLAALSTAMIDAVVMFS